MVEVFSAPLVERSRVFSSSNFPATAIFPILEFIIMVSSCRIALVGDNVSMLDAISASITRCGYDVAVAVSSSEELMNQCRLSPPDLLIAEIDLELEPFIQLYDVPMIALCDRMDSSVTDRAKEFGAMACLLKPIRIEEILIAIPIALQCHQKMTMLSAKAAEYQKALEDRKVVEKAKGLVMEKLNMSEANAHRHLQTQAREQRKTLIDVASSIVSAAHMFTCTALATGTFEQ